MLRGPQSTLPSFLLAAVDEGGGGHQPPHENRRFCNPLVADLFHGAAPSSVAPSLAAEELCLLVFSLKTPHCRSLHRSGASSEGASLSCNLVMRSTRAAPGRSRQPHLGAARLASGGWRAGGGDGRRRRGGVGVGVACWTNVCKPYSHEGCHSFTEWGVYRFCSASCARHA